MSAGQQAQIDTLERNYRQLWAAYTALADEQHHQPFFRRLDKHQIERALQEPLKVIHGSEEVVLTTDS